MLSLYGKYVYEREGKSIVESEHGFATFIYLNDQKSVYIEDIYVVPEQRKSGLAQRMIDEVAEIAKQKGYHTLVGSVAPKANHSTESLRLIVQNGFKLHSSDNSLIWFKKEIK